MLPAILMFTTKANGPPQWKSRSPDSFCRQQIQIHMEIAKQNISQPTPTVRRVEHQTKKHLRPPMWFSHFGWILTLKWTEQIRRNAITWMVFVSYMILERPKQLKSWRSHAYIYMYICVCCLMFLYDICLNIYIYIIERERERCNAMCIFCTWDLMGIYLVGVDSLPLAW